MRGAHGEPPGSSRFKTGYRGPSTVYREPCAVGGGASGVYREPPTVNREPCAVGGGWVRLIATELG